MTGHAASKRWRVFRQHHNHAETETCAHHFGWVAELCAIRRESSRQHSSEVGVHYVARPAVKP